ncbi:RepB family plasmid replication initiator protein [Chryseobacterium sp. CFBP8996]|uniref:RepB family plasmid replication initiator protein n=1 Tax=Chryseobacterium sp. CFBP8996 TaxID=3096529 RepID=UPI002A6B74C5|nr:RepB family plasmid replication initiator protein [Chryseobacterium sp. CFBP8996]MDY0930782.1 RepB family plasmid replication initiator protein [Chryseobacterium sp. CFBP8996]
MAKKEAQPSVKREMLTSKPRKKVLISNDFREILISQETSIIEQRIITMILSAIKDEQSMFISVKPPTADSTNKQLSFDDYFEGWAHQGVIDFSVSINDLNPGRKMKNSVIQEALVNMTNINWLRLKDDTINGYKAVPFILEPSWNKKNIFFKMDKAVMQHLLNMSQYYSIKKDLSFNTSTNNTLRFLMWIVKFNKLGGIVKDYTQLLKELFIPLNKYEGHYRFERDFLVRVKADLDNFNDISFNYSYKEGNYHFVIYNTQNAVGVDEKFPTLDQLQIERALKYLKKQRGLDDQQVRVMKKLYEVKGYKELSKHLKRKIEINLKGEGYIKAVFALLEQI